MKSLIVIVLTVWILSGLYFGLGGISRISVDEVVETLNARKNELIKDTINVDVDGITVKNRYEYMVLLEHDNVEEYFPWAMELTSFSALLVTAMSFGLLGAVISLFHDISINKNLIEDVSYISKPILGLLTGLVVLGISHLLPALIIKNTSEIRPLSLMFFSLFCGIYTSKFYEKLAILFEKKLSSK